MSYILRYNLYQYRLFFVVARNGHAPALLNTVHLTRKTPAASVMALVSVQSLWMLHVPESKQRSTCKSARDLQGVLSAGALLLWSDMGPLLTSTSYLSNLHDTVTVSTLLYFRWRLARSRSGERQHTSRVPLPLAVPLLVIAFQFVVQLGAPFHESLKEPGTFAHYTRINNARRCCPPRHWNLVYCCAIGYQVNFSQTFFANKFS